MCGIIGVLSWRRPPDRAAVAALLPLLAHRGPDDRGTAVSGSACFGHTRLSIVGVDQPEARQPATDGRHLLTFNGEIYNFRELVAALRAEGIAAGGHSDTEALFLALAHWGVARTLARLDGMFAFAWYDADARTLSLVRDPLGEKFLYWADGPEGFWFASEIKPLIAAGAAGTAPNLRRIDDYFYTGKVNGAETMFRDVHEVEPGCVVTVSADAAPRARAWWSLTGTAAGPREASEFPARLAAAVASRRIADVPVGILLSGGIDSCGLVELLLADTPDARLDLYFADNADASMSERADAEIFLRHVERRYPAAELRFRPNLIAFDDYQERLADVTWYYDEPVQFANTPLLHGLCDLARGAGLKVLLSGEGADELLHGYDRFARTLAEVRGAGDARAVMRALYFGGGQHSVDAVRGLAGGVAEGAEATASWLWMERHLGDFPLERFQLLFSQRFRLQMLLQRQDRVGMAKSIEIRVPYLAPGFAAWCNGLPVSELFDEGTGETKRILRRTVADRLPERILTKAKDGFPSDMLVWLREDRLRAVVSALVAEPDGFSQSYLDGRYANRLVEDHFAGRRRLDVLVWELYALEIWHRVFRGGVSLRAPLEAEAA
jgi:asparagine synthase (glutamine-hydrolysing)